jgi:hypothetical protein
MLRFRLGARASASALVAVGLISFGCASRPATDTPLVVSADEPATVAALDRSGRREVQGAFNDLAAGRQAVERPSRSASPRGRWQDVYLATLYACDDLEAAVTASRQTPDRWEFDLRTAEDWPGTLLVSRRSDEQVFDARAKVGVFGDRVEQAELLVKAFEAHMAAFGQKRVFQAPDAGQQP